MQSSLKTRPSPSRVLDIWALLSFGLWTMGAVISAWVGIWSGVGGAAILLGGLSVLIHREFFVDQLRPSLRLVLLGVGGGVVITAATYLIYPLAASLPLPIVEQTELLYARFRNASPLVIGVILPLCVVGEELVWRGVVQEALTRRCGVVGGLLLATCAYAAAQVPTGSGLLPLIGIGCGIFWGALRAYSRSLVPPLVCHLIWDIVVFSLFPLAP